MDFAELVKNSEPLFRPFRRLFAGFSGGADSTLALLTAAEYCRRHPECRLTAVHFEHGLRGTQSVQEAKRATEFAKKHSIDFVQISLGLDPRLPGIEAAARSARLEEWKRLVSSRSDCAVVLGHHADDRVEGLFLRLARGSNVSGAVSPRRRSEVDGVTFLRPLLDLSRREVEKTLHDLGIFDWNTDSSNLGNDYCRNRLRNSVLPEFYRAVPGSADGLRTAVKTLEEDADFIECEAEKIFAAGEPERLDFWKNLHPALMVRVLRRFSGVISGQESIRRFQRILRSTPGKTALLPLGGGATLKISGGSVKIVSPALPLPEPLRWEWRRNKTVSRENWLFEAEETGGFSAASAFEAYFDADLMPDTLSISAPVPGDRMIPFGHRSPVKLKKLRIDRKIPASPVFPVIRTPDGEIVFAPGIRQSNAFRITPETRRIVRLRCHIR